MQVSVRSKSGIQSRSSNYSNQSVVVQKQLSNSVQKPCKPCLFSSEAVQVFRPWCQAGCSQLANLFSVFEQRSRNFRSSPVSNQCAVSSSNQLIVLVSCEPSPLEVMDFSLFRRWGYKAVGGFILKDATRSSFL